MRVDERGSAPVEMVLLTPVLLVLLLFVVAVGRIADARGQVEAAARDAARAGTLARSPARAQTEAIAAVEARLDQGGAACRHLATTIDASRFAAGGAVTASVTCTVDLGDLTLLRIPGSRAVTATATEPVDRFRGIEP